jgi:hypothetical protein
MKKRTTKRRKAAKGRNNPKVVERMREIDKKLAQLEETIEDMKRKTREEEKN